MQQILHFIIVLLALVSVAFFTLLERKVLSSRQTRVGPNKVGIIGLLQPFRDAIKLFTKANLVPSSSSRILFLFVGPFILSLSIALWITIQAYFPYLLVKHGFLVFLLLRSLNVFPVFLAGWASNRIYAILGALRTGAQTISYEISLIFIVILIIVLGNQTFILRSSFPLFFISGPLFMLWLITILAECHRAPFDFAEGESELVSGYNVEFRSRPFAVLFLAEYINILFIRIITSLLFFSSYLISFFFVYFYLICRSTFPRFRYDLLILLCWIFMLPISICLLASLAYALTILDKS